MVASKYSEFEVPVRIAGILTVSLLIAQPCYAAHWQAVGPSSGGSSSGTVYVDLDSVHEEEGYRLALFLTIYAVAVPNTHGIKLDRITQETAFDCKQRRFALRSTVGYFEGKEVGLSSQRGDWRASFRAVPSDTFSQRALDLVCNSALAPQPEPTGAPDEAPSVVKLPGP
jgi:hypothetical protein